MRPLQSGEVPQPRSFSPALGCPRRDTLCPWLWENESKALGGEGKGSQGRAQSSRWSRDGARDPPPSPAHRCSPEPGPQQSGLLSNGASCHLQPLPGPPLSLRPLTPLCLPPPSPQSMASSGPAATGTAARASRWSSWCSRSLTATRPSPSPGPTTACAPAAWVSRGPGGRWAHQAQGTAAVSLGRGQGTRQHHCTQAPVRP